jgi:hypothetical protein
MQHRSSESIGDPAYADRPRTSDAGTIACTHPSRSAGYTSHVSRRSPMPVYLMPPRFVIELGRGGGSPNFRSRRPGLEVIVRTRHLAAWTTSRPTSCAKQLRAVRRRSESQSRVPTIARNRTRPCSQRRASPTRYVTPSAHDRRKTGRKAGPGSMDFQGRLETSPALRAFDIPNVSQSRLPCSLDYSTVLRQIEYEIGFEARQAISRARSTPLGRHVSRGSQASRKYPNPVVPREPLHRNMETPRETTAAPSRDRA